MRQLGHVAPLLKPGSFVSFHLEACESRTLLEDSISATNFEGKLAVRVSSMQSCLHSLLDLLLDFFVAACVLLTSGEGNKSHI